MEYGEFITMLLAVLATTIPLFIACITPIIKLNKSIQKLNDAIDQLNRSDSKKEVMLDAVSKRLNVHGQYLDIDKRRLDNLSLRMKKLDNEEGFIDNSNRNL